jgi:hypothetical protein
MALRCERGDVRRWRHLRRAPARHFNQIINGIGSAQRCLKYRFFARTNHIDIIEVWVLVFRHTEPVADHFPCVEL